MAKVALLIGVSEYELGLDPLPSATQDVLAMQQVLSHPDMGEFAADAVTVLQNPDRQTMETAIYYLFANRQKDDLVLLYFSGHGVVDDGGEFYFATRQTQKDQGRLVPTTAVAARPVQTWMEQSSSQRQVVILDSCYSGAFAKGVRAKDSGSVNLEQFLGGRGRAILTASTSTQYAFAQDGLDLSVYTHYLVEGIRTGGADQDNDGFIAVEELHAYASAKVREAAPAMTPEFYPVKDGYKILLAKSPKDDPKLKYRKAVKVRADEGRFSIPARRLLNSLRGQLGLSVEVAAEIEAEVLQPYQEYQRKLQEYEQTLSDALENENPLSVRTLADLQDYQEHLALLDDDVAPIQAKLLGRTLKPATTIQDFPQSSLPELDPDATYFEFEVVTLNAEGQENSRRQERARYVTEDLGNGTHLDMVVIPAGEFLMGQTEAEKQGLIRQFGEADYRQFFARELPQHRVRVPGFLMGKYPVTQAQYEVVMGSNPSNFKGANRPVERVSWEDAMAFCAKLSARTQKDYRLPSEAEWEYACRAGTTTPFYFGDIITPDFVNYDGDYTYNNSPKGIYREQTSEVGTFPPNGFGLYDMHGNVWEWCLDHWHENYEGAPENGSAWLFSDKDKPRLVRGGCRENNPRSCRSASRDSDSPDYAYGDVGFRVACAAPRTL